MRVDRPEDDDSPDPPEDSGASEFPGHRADADVDALDAHATGRTVGQAVDGSADGTVDGATDRATDQETDHAADRATDEADRTADRAAPETGRAAYFTEYRDKVDDAYRAYAIDQGCARVREIEKNETTPAMLRIESVDPERKLVGFKNRLKGEARLAEKVSAAIAEQPDLTYEQAFATVKDAIRYTFEYSESRYADGVYADCDRLKAEGFEPVDRRNTWDTEQYKGINSRWRCPDSGQIFEVQFHTRASFDAKQETHAAYEKMRIPTTPKAEQDRLAEYQREVTARVPVPAGATDIPNYP